MLITTQTLYNVNDDVDNIENRIVAPSTSLIVDSDSGSSSPSVLRDISNTHNVLAPVSFSRGKRKHAERFLAEVNKQIAAAASVKVARHQCLKYLRFLSGF